MKKILTLCSLMMIGACSSNWDVDGVAKTEAQGTRFDKSLKSEYVELAIVERHFGDWDEVDRLLTKAVNAGEGNVVVLAPPPVGMINSQAGLNDLETVRTRLMDEFKKGARDKKPEASAQAQVAYECMINSYKWDFKEDVEFCRGLFESAMIEIQGKKVATKTVAKSSSFEPQLINSSNPLVESKQETVVTAPAKKSAIPAALRKAYEEDGKSYMLKDGKYIVYYAFGSSQPAQDVDSMLKDVVMEYRIVDPAKVAVSGYADTAGSAKVNEALSLRRAKTVANALVKYGMEASKLETKGFGEKDLAVPTADGVAEPLNRRTTIEFK